MIASAMEGNIIFAPAPAPSADPTFPGEEHKQPGAE